MLLGGAALALGFGRGKGTIGYRGRAVCQPRLHWIAGAALMFENRAPKVARQRRPERGYVTIGAGDAGQGVRHRRRRRFACLLLGRRAGDRDDQPSPEPHHRARPAPEHERFGILLVRNGGSLVARAIGHHDLPRRRCGRSPSRTMRTTCWRRSPSRSSAASNSRSTT